MAGTKVAVLYVDDEENNLFSFKAVFRIKYEVYTAISAEKALEILAEKPIAIIITDQRMPNITGVEFLEIVVKKFPDPMRLLLTGYTDMGTVIDAVNKGKIFHYLTKPWNEQEVEQAIEQAYLVYNEKQKLTNNNKR